MSKIQFRNAAHRDFVLENLDKCKVNDCYHRAFFYVMGISEETRMNIGKMFDFKRDCIIPEGMHGGWQTSGTVKVCHLAFNLWNGFTEIKGKVADLDCATLPLISGMDLRKKAGKISIHRRNCSVADMLRILWRVSS